MNKKQTGKALVAVVTLGHIEFEGLMLSNGDYAIAVSQLDALGLVRQNQASRDVKTLLGKEFKFDKTSSELNRKPVNIISLLDFEKLLAKLDRKGNKSAQDLRDDLVGVTLTQLFSEAFGQKFEKDETQQFLKERQEGRFIRRTLTDVVKSYIENNPQLSDNDKKWMYPNTSDTVNRLLFGKSAKQLCEFYGCEKEQLRNHFDRKDIVRIRRLEEYAMRLIDTQNVHPIEVVKKAFEFWDGARV
ncbi:MAG: hypothetical protein F6K54_16280 [Okeania sp. SIO3B5]|uniref:hypothetical protein n=1 Tax=Okeania sp. SIO3B5 TaxID=2607811 RepID=UPI00140132C3|nr:hypothetical protein [Okeania sp. SIO3B5]NEO54501.1 hypothetical protein [Okeania sp. SIO3B5]